MTQHVYLAGIPSVFEIVAATPLVGDQPTKLLCSFHYFKKIDMDELAERFKRPMIFADSGAFSAYNAGAPVDVHEYAAWLKRWKHRFTVYSNLDVIRDAEATARNQAILESYDLEPAPVYHAGSPLSVLDGLAERYAYIALGGMVRASWTSALRWSATCMERAPHVRFHGFGQTRIESVAELPWYSIDSSTWLNGVRYGLIPLWNHDRIDVLNIQRPAPGRPGMQGNPFRDMRVRAIIREAGCDPAVMEQLSGPDFRTHAIRLAAWSWRKFELYLRDRHGHEPSPNEGEPA